MQLSLTDQQAEILRGLLSDHLPELRREASRTERHELRHLLIERQELVEDLLRQLPPASS